jgi:hypothetical protein
MRVITSLSLVACLPPPVRPVPVRHTRSGKPAIRACEVLTRDVVAKFDTGNPKMRDLIPRDEEAIGSHGSSCNDGSIFVQIDPFLNSDSYRKSPAKDWQAVSGVGDTAYFHNNRDRYAELMVWSGKASLHDSVERARRPHCGSGQAQHDRNCDRIDREAQVDVAACW